ncbi:unnamed protein product [Acanthosepion pharaonis]|uniref:Uncharacterized protein n=1 Tax=Acanthosepion pharaonis TaxID=158019 RepID=A0A812CM39_ACAPH|nr:unnamed protein product [Sepia pharaonis]
MLSTLVRAEGKAQPSTSSLVEIQGYFWDLGTLSSSISLALRFAFLFHSTFVFIVSFFFFAFSFSLSLTFSFPLCVFLYVILCEILSLSLSLSLFISLLFSFSLFLDAILYADSCGHLLLYLSCSPPSMPFSFYVIFSTSLCLSLALSMNVFLFLSDLFSILFLGFFLLSACNTVSASVSLLLHTLARPPFFAIFRFFTFLLFTFSLSLSLSLCCYLYLCFTFFPSLIIFSLFDTLLYVAFFLYIFFLMLLFLSFLSFSFFAPPPSLSQFPYDPLFLSVDFCFRYMRSSFHHALFVPSFCP